MVVETMTTNGDGSLMAATRDTRELDRLLEALRQPDPESLAPFEELRRQPHDPRACPWCRLLQKEHEEAS